ncbi:putative glycolipid-binding domain-containing protein [Micromonospora sp. WMMA1363]|uniref:putative glycolipid-binding domain-containing protein n=1 Tax=Micromonospora sp. WMMA1363 TaxID=3053985 RepID=UPI00259C9FCF|nr:putative glycolipid-binding domain-containing protein [Micromonospora sp. WMMA1363]MDM4722046.1 putative glycolipid-binding domain-containing protein [Micromonospora sp. WMMA1363]
MPTMPKSFLWTRTDAVGAEHALVDDGRGLTARGTQVAVDPIPYTCRYQLTTDPEWMTTGLVVEAEGSGWLRTIRLERAADRWRVTTAEQGDLDAALAVADHPPAGLPGTDDPDRLVDAVDVDLGGSPLFNTLPVRRLGLTGSPVDTAHRVPVAWVLVPSLSVVFAEQVYTALGPDRVRFASDTFTAELDLDDAGYVLCYPGLAKRAEPR